MGNSNFFKERLSILSLLVVLAGTTGIFASELNYSTFFGPISYNPGLSGTKSYKVNFGGPAGNSSQINSVLLIKNGNGVDIALETCKRLQLSCLLRNLLKEVELVVLRPRSLTVSINNVVVFSKNDYDPKKGVFEKPFLAGKSNVMDIKIQGLFTSAVTISAKASALNVPPLAEFSYSAPDLIAPATVNFSGLLSRDQDSGYITDYNWNFGDGSFGSGSLISHLYSNPGDYTVVLTVTDNAGAKASQSQVVKIKANQNPVSVFMAQTKTDLGDLLVLVDGSGSSDSDGKIVEYIVDWGDQSAPEISLSSAKFEHRYLSQGTYQISLWVKDDRSASSYSSQNVLVQDQKAPLLMVLSPVANTNLRGNRVSVSIQSNEKLKKAEGAVGSELPSALLISADGQSISGELVISNEGANQISIQAADLVGNVTEISTTVFVAFNNAPLVSFVSPESVGISSVVSFDASESKDIDGTIEKYIWNFQDGSDVVAATLPKTQHVFTQSGNFNVQLTVIDNEGGTSTFSRNIYINAKPIAGFSSKTLGQNLTLEFDANLSSDLENDTLQFNWQFGDGTTGTGKITTHTFAQAGTYAVVLNVADSYSSVSLTQSVVVAPVLPPDDDHEGQPSPGILELASDLDKVFNPLEETVVLKLSGAQFGDLTHNSTRVFVNDQLTDVIVTIDGSFLKLNGLLISGKNEIRVTTVDQNNLDLDFSTTIWAGNRSLTITPISETGAVIASAVTTRVQVFDDTEMNVTFDGQVLINLPNEKLIVTVADSLGRIGTEVCDKDVTSKTIILRAAEPVSLVDNNDFSADLNGWKIENATVSHLAHVETDTVTDQNFDLNAAGTEPFKIIRSFQPKSDTQQVSLRFKISGFHPEDAYMVIFRGLSSHDVFIEQGRLADFGLLSPVSSAFSSLWIESGYNLKITGEPVQVTLLALPYSGAIAKNDGFKKTKTVWQQLFEHWLVPSAVAADEPVNLTVDALMTNPYCVQDIDFVDYLPKLGTAGYTAYPKLSALSVGKIPGTYNGGKNTIAARVKLCSGSSVARWDLEVIVANQRILLATQSGPLINAPNGKEDVVFDISTINGVNVLEQVATLLPNPDTDPEYTLSLVLRARDAVPADTTGPLSFSTGVASKKRSVYPLVRETFSPPSRYSEKRDDLSMQFPDGTTQIAAGGDDWVKPHVLKKLKGMISDYGGKLSFNDISNMNGGQFVPHGGHQKGQNIDFRIKDKIGNFLAANSPASVKQDAAKELVEYFKKYHRYIRLMYFSHLRPGNEDISISEESLSDEATDISIDINRPVWNYLRHQCYEKKLVRSKIKHKASHIEHFHVELNPSIETIASIGPVDLGISVGINGIVTFDKPLFTDGAVGQITYEAYIEKTVNGITDFYPIVNGTNPIQGSGVIKIKLLKIKRLNANISACSETMTSIGANTSATGLSFVYLHLKPEGICGGAFMKPVRGNFSQLETENALPPEYEIGWVANGANVSNAGVGAGVYVCPGSSVTDKSLVIAGEDSLIEVIGSHISHGSTVAGNIVIKNSNIDHADISGLFSLSKWTPADPITTIADTDITDLTNEAVNESYTPPIQIYGRVNVVGSLAKRVKIERSKTPIQLPLDLSGSVPVIVGPQLFSVNQPIEITDGAIIKDSFIDANRPATYQNLPVTIAGGSTVDSSFISGHVSITDKASVQASGIFGQGFPSGTGPSVPVFHISISGAEVFSSHVVGDGTISGYSTKITKSTIYNAFVIDSGSIIQESFVSGSTVTASQVVNDSVITESNIIDGSTVSDSTVIQSQVNKSTILNKSNIEKNSVILESQVTNSRVTEASLMLRTTANGSWITGGSSVDSSVANSDIYQSQIKLMTINTATVVSSILTGPNIYSDVVLDSICFNETDDDGKEVFKCKLKVPPEVP